MGRGWKIQLELRGFRQASWRRREVHLFSRAPQHSATDWVAQTTKIHFPHNIGVHHLRARCWQGGFLLRPLSLQLANGQGPLPMSSRDRPCPCVRVLILLPRLLIIQFFLGLICPRRLCRSSSLPTAVDFPSRIVIRTASPPHIPF